MTFNVVDFGIWEGSIIVVADEAGDLPYLGRFSHSHIFFLDYRCA